MFKKFKIALISILLLTPIMALGQVGSATVSAQGGFALNAGDVLTISAQIVGCQGNVPLYGGIPVSITPNQTASSPFTANSSQFVTFTVPGNDKITCGGQNYTQYAITWKINGFPAAPTQTYRFADAFSVLLNGLTPTGFYPPNLANAAGFSCPTGTNLQGFDMFFTPTCGPSVTTNMPNADSSGEILVSPSAGNNWQTLAQMRYQMPGDTITSIEANCAASPCTYVVTSPQSITLSANHTLSSNVNLQFMQGGKWTVNGAFTLTIPGNVTGTLSQHFLGAATVKFGVLQSLAPVEWFGAAGDGVADDTSEIQATLNALTSGQAWLQARTYLVSSALTINKPNVGIKGSNLCFASPTIYATPTCATIKSNSASADIIDVAGVSTSNTITFNKFEDFSLQRSVAPSGTAAGLSLNFTYGIWVHRVSSEDSISDFYIHGSGSQGVGDMEDCVASDGYRGLSEAGLTLYGWNLDSSDGVGNNSFRIRNSFFASNLGATATTTGLYVHGTELNDLMVNGFETANASFGEQFIQTATASPISGSDIHLWGVVNDSFFNIGVLVQGLTTSGGGSLEINGGYIASAHLHTSGVDIESSTGVSVSNVQFAAFVNNADNAIFVHNSSDVNIIGNRIQAVITDGIVLGQSTAVSVVGNNLKGINASTGLIRLTGSSLNAIIGNTMTGTGQSLVVDSSSINNTGFSSDIIAASLAAPVIAGSNPLSLGTTQQVISQSGAPSGACGNGSLYLNSATTAGTFASYQCKGGAWVGLGTAY